MAINKEKPKVVILCGGQGTRLKEQTEFMPKPLVPVGGKPILWHIMKGYDSQGFDNFVLCLGYKGNMVKDYFIHYHDNSSDIEVSLKTGSVRPLTRHGEDWDVTLVDTGEASQTALRVGKVKSYLEKDPYFMLTYGDGVANVDFRKLIDFHKQSSEKSGTIGTITGVHLHSRYGAIKTNEQGVAQSFVEKPLLEDLVNGGFMVLNREFLEHPMLQQNVALETILEDLTNKGKLAVYKHAGAWHSMDTQRDYEILNKLWEETKGKAPWVTWSD